MDCNIQTTRGPVNKGITILVADRNRHVREFLKRELAAVGYGVRLAKNSREVLNWVNHYPPPDILILDLNLPDEPEVGILEKLRQTMPSLPVVVHSFTWDYDDCPAVVTAAAFVEKRGGSIEELKRVVREVLKEQDPAAPAGSEET
jgi:DNA-binding NtrC family response regulator